ncbi:hypothetical protein [Corynebacterium tapiri]|uniref:Uncharacterized protein n=1 Tax=Corynebacterium tapiri TaxID=1448266 RepID=A0A5C4U1R5_9CORY|nr:hypothetical protein [Corynebacterium tapiri]TNL95729.1 hypothetical protein FHE74_09040 [Corynebacterium tapiri]
MIVAFIVFCEFAFWAAIGTGLLLRYRLNKPKAGLVALSLSPVIDLALLIATTIDLRGGGEVQAPHFLAAFYIGFSVMFGRSMVQWADETYRRRVLGHDVPLRVNTLTSELKSLARAAGAVAVAGLIAEVVRLVAPEAAELRQTWSIGGSILFLWLIFGPGWQLVFGSRKPASAR